MADIMPKNPSPDDEPVVERTRMSFGDHLEELRKRVLWSLIGLVIATILCFHFGGHIIKVLETPYSVAMKDGGYDPRLVQLNPVEGFIEYFKIALKFGLLVSAPWVLYQLWCFVAAGLYAAERRVVRLFAPTSIALFVTGATFMVTVVLSGLMTFLIGVSTWFPLPKEDSWLYQWLSDAVPAVAVVTTRPTDLPARVPVVTEDPESPAAGQIWFNAHTRRLVIQGAGETRFTAPFQKASRQQFVQPFFSVSEYLGFVVNLALAFGLGFQIPIVVVFLAVLRIVEVATLARARKYVILGVCILAAILTPTPDVATMMMLAVPMVLLFEIGLLIAGIIERRRAEEPAVDD